MRTSSVQMQHCVQQEVFPWTHGFHSYFMTSSRFKMRPRRQIPILSRPHCTGCKLSSKDCSLLLNFYSEKEYFGESSLTSWAFLSYSTRSHYRPQQSEALSPWLHGFRRSHAACFTHPTSRVGERRRYIRTAVLY